MLCFKINFNSLVQISLLNKEHLVPPRPHLTRQTNTNILYLVTEGELALEQNGEELQLKAGDVALFAKGATQKPLKIAECKYYYIHFNADVTPVNISEEEYFQLVRSKNMEFANASRYNFDKYNNLEVYLPAVIHISEKSTLEHLVEKIKKCIPPQNFQTVGKYLGVSYEVLKLFCRLEKVGEAAFGHGNKQNSSIYSAAEKIADYLEKHYLEDVGSRQIEETFMMNYDYANRIFGKVMGKSIIRYRNDLRLERAKLLLLTTELRVDEVAFRSGFSDKYYFSRFFTKSVGVSPKRFREEERGYI